MKLESASDAKNTYAGAISSGCAGRSSCVFLPNSATSSGSFPSSAAFSGVQTGPGATQLTRNPFLDEILRQRLGQCVDRVLRRRIIGQLRRSLDAGDRSGGDDGRPAIQMRQRRL